MTRNNLNIFGIIKIFIYRLSMETI